MTTKTKKLSERASNAAQRWQEGTNHYQEAFKPVAQKIHDKAKEMREAGAEPIEIVEMATNLTKEFAEEYHDQKQH